MPFDFFKFVPNVLQEGLEAHFFFIEMGQLLQDPIVLVFVVVEVAFEFLEDTIQFDANISFDVGVVSIKLFLEGVFGLTQYAHFMLVGLHVGISVTQLFLC